MAILTRPGRAAIAKAPEGLPHFSDEAYQCRYDLAGANPIEQAYSHLKKLPEFAGAVDC